MYMILRPPAWLLVLVGLMLNILALLISSLVLEDYSQLNAQYQEKKEGNQHQIQLAWSRIENLERKREALLTFVTTLPMLSSEDALILEQEMSEQLESWVGQPVPNIAIGSLKELFQLIETAQQTQRNRIDDLYLENLELTDEMSQIHKDSAQYNNLALFLQIFGLALILARDLARKPT
ncbi:conserved hypothetical protein [Vibrio nigripulchritudo SFn27]|uniref:DNA mismatch repair protein n=2 Tax=Vibrio nigripulchritudo TaxID=28173 RepID=U4KCA6_9VIBR|nr:conserved hypothetical protein [Vibrio nigripulchritudo BLFn1]CCN87962.1 conserved hypothetical protein [Vibrio nigripulchritudo SFn27]CCN96817.1 conserved hypothetical protein [Vibrio nigripulchritudo ENn2]CCO43530.1 conserved hypothetical protein [Vibrio nigripulchritudo SFn135]CCO51565.1 conserved hypothetical protein [Vibrio nigripulchritudo Wn13]CCO60508.1 conserved hypothetical protein [Vibrio nigripulchritudo]